MRSYTPVVPSKTETRFRQKWAKSIPVFRPKRRKNHTLWGDRYLYSLYNPPPPPPSPLHTYTRSNPQNSVHYMRCQKVYSEP